MPLPRILSLDETRSMNTAQAGASNLTGGSVTPGSIPAIAAMTLVDFIAIFSNFVTIIVILKQSKLRQNITYVFILNLCLTDLFGAIILLPLSITVYSKGKWPWNADMCIAKGFLISLITFVSILSMCTISVERFYLIKYPMHYSGHMTMCRAAFIIVMVWLYSFTFSVFPLVGWNAYIFIPQKTTCSFSWNAEGPHRLFSLVVTFMCFIVPGCILIAMYCGIYRVAKKVAIRVRPERVPKSEVRNIPDVRTSAPADQPMCAMSCAFFQTGSQLKAIKTLMLIMAMYVILWGPYFVIHLQGTILGHLDVPDNIELMTMWFGYSSFAINPFVYGCLNRTIREELTIFLRKLFCCHSAHTDEDVQVRPGESFYQFLDRTTCKGRTAQAPQVSQPLPRACSVDPPMTNEDMCF